MEKRPTDKLKSTIISTTGGLMRLQKSPDEAFGSLFTDVQESGAYTDGKMFPDLVPRHRIRQIQKEYLLEKQDPHFDIRDFVSRHFYVFDGHKTAYKTDPHMTVTQHISELWDVLERRNRRNRGSLIALPYTYVVPGGRFNEQFYWDSYFIMLGLASDNRWDKVEGMVRNFAYMINRFGFVPTANRTYFLSRSQPPFFAAMVRLLATHRGQGVLVEYLPQMLREYRFWMRGRTKLAAQEHKAFARVAEMPNGVLLNRYYDNKTTPRPESLHADTAVASNAAGRQADRVFLHLRAAAESGWDFSSRWLEDPTDLRTIHTADIIPIDLNCLLYQLELTIAEAYQLARQSVLSRRFHAAAEQRAKTINRYCWDKKNGFYGDFNFHHKVMTGRETLAAVYPLYARIATTSQANQVAQKLEADFLKPGGLVTSLVDGGQQWDSPNGWAPLQYIAIQGLRNYGHHRLADKIKRRWIKTNLKIFSQNKKLVEKYNVVDLNRLGGGGEYPLQDGFGWTNGVLAALLSE